MRFLLPQTDCCTLNLGCECQRKMDVEFSREADSGMNVKGSFGLILHLGDFCSSHSGILLLFH